ncbi:uncharacterized protein LOC112461090 [Temnothorax curvispinosus]|uniref:Uncharacterized protein LOC112461090 n=1 Tax=Temnothorax curvispinosus TaxID=300111 RepID=A0A6J1QJ90_9HYME|nr:uncharacterized protein LOC112461090 [Temnothorax curvispinosus]
MVSIVDKNSVESHLPACKKNVHLTDNEFFRHSLHCKLPALLRHHIGAKKPKRDNRKAPDYAADTLGPALFSTPDIIRRSVQPEPQLNFDGGNSIIPGSENEQKSESKASLIEELQPSLDTGGIEGEEHLLATLEMEANKLEELLAEALLLQEELGVDLAEHFVELVELDNKAQVTQLLGDEKSSTRRGSRSSLANIEREQSHEEANSSLPLV